MRRLLTLIVAFAVALWVSGLSTAVAQGRSGANKPAQTGVEHAEQTANPRGVKHGIENAETKQGKEDADAAKKGKDKGKAKGKKTRTRKHKHAV